jgi:hypothetical protein
MTKLARRAFSISVVALAMASACKREARCQRCGMVLDPTSRWRVEAKSSDGATLVFDTPKCAFTFVRTRGLDLGAMTFQAYYSQKSMKTDALTFGVGSDVQGPMGDDFVPVETSLATKFRAEHEAKQMLAATEITRELAEGM